MPGIGGGGGEEGFIKTEYKLLTVTVGASEEWASTSSEMI